MDIMQNPIVIAVLALTVVPGIASALTALLRKGSDGGIKPQAVLYVVSAVMTALVMFTSGSKLPLVDAANPTETIMAWQVFTGAFVLYTGTLYDVLLKRFWPGPSPEPTPEPVAAKPSAKNPS